MGCAECGGMSQLMYKCNSKRCNMGSPSFSPCPSHSVGMSKWLNCTNHVGQCELALEDTSVAYSTLEPFKWNGISPMPTGFQPKLNLDWFSFFKEKNHFTKKDFSKATLTAYEKLFPDRR